MERKKDGTLIWWRRNITKRLMKYFDITSSAWMSKLKGNRKTRWDEVSMRYIKEGKSQKIYP